MSEAKGDPDEKTHDRPTVVRNATDLQRLKLEKLMRNPDKPIIISEKPKERGMPAVPEFVRNVMGSSAGAGSGEFHVYRHLRRKEYARQKFMKERGERDRLEDEYHEKLEANKRKADEKTAKKRAKRLKRKGKMKNKKNVSKTDKSSSQSEDESSSEDEQEKDDDKDSDEVKNKNDEVEVVEEPSSKEDTKNQDDEVHVEVEEVEKTSLKEDAPSQCTDSNLSEETDDNSKAIIIVE